MGKPRRKMRSYKANRCTGKRAFDTLEAADAAAYRPRGTLNRGNFMQGYRCPHCRLFHYGHPPSK